MFGLIEGRGGRYGFRDLAAARQVAGLSPPAPPVDHHPEPDDIRKWLPDAGLSN